MKDFDLNIPSKDTGEQEQVINKAVDFDLNKSSEEFVLEEKKSNLRKEAKTILPTSDDYCLDLPLPKVPLEKAKKKDTGNPERNKEYASKKKSLASENQDEPVLLTSEEGEEFASDEALRASYTLCLMKHSTIDAREKVKLEQQIKEAQNPERKDEHAVPEEAKEKSSSGKKPRQPRDLAILKALVKDTPWRD